MRPAPAWRWLGNRLAPLWVAEALTRGYRLLSHR